MERNKSKTVIWVLAIVVILLLLVIAYVLAIRPAIAGYGSDSYVSGYQYAILNVMQQAATCQQVPLVAGNQTINIVAVECLQQAQQAAQ